MLREVAQQLDDWILQRNFEFREEGLPQLRKCTIKVLGQTALLELGVPLALAATRDVDVVANYEHSVELEFRRLLAARGKDLDALAHEAWMPRETKYCPIFEGEFVTLLCADAEAVLVSKALKAPEKNRVLLLEYLAQGATERFNQLAEKYSLDVEQFL